MCLTLKSEAELQTATEDIIVYKYIDKKCKINISAVNSGQTFESVIKGIKCEGKISVKGTRVYFCTDDERLHGVDCDDKQGYKYSWGTDLRVDLSKTTIDGNPIPMGYITPYREMLIEIGETYHSELRRYGNTVEEGLHSYACIETMPTMSTGIKVECIIPAGSRFYDGVFDGRASYASDKLKYVKIIELS